MLKATNLTGFNATRPPAGGGSKSATYQGREDSTSGGSSYTFTSFTAVTAGANVDVVLCIMGGNTATTGLSSVSVYGQSATLPGDIMVEVLNDFESNDEYCAWLKVAIPSTSTNDIVVTFDAVVDHHSISVYHCDGLGSVNDTATATTTTTAMTLDVNTNADDFVFAASMNFWDGRSVTWTGVTEETGNDGVFGNSHYASVGSALSGVTSETPRTVTSTFSGGIYPMSTGAAFSIG